MELESLLQFLTPDENLATFFSRLESEQLHAGIPFIDEHVSLKPGVFLEIAGPHRSGKSELLVQLAVNSLVASHADNNNAASKVVVFIDLDGHFDPLRLIQ
eukprot:gene12082-15191_t